MTIRFESSRFDSIRSATKTWRTLPVLALTLLLLLPAACGKAPETGEDGAQAAPENRFLSLGTAPPGGAFFVVGSALAEVLDRHHREAGWRVTAEATKGSQENIRRLDQGQLDLALSNAAITYFAIRGEGGWDRAYPMSSVVTLAPNVALFIAPESSGIRSIQDLRGKRVVVGPAGAGFEYFIRPLLEAHGITYDDFTPLNAPQSAAVDMLADGAAAAAFLGGAVPTPSIEQATTTQDITFIPLDPAAREKLIADYPFFRPAVIPAGTYAGLDEDYQGLDVGSMHVIVANSADEEWVYQITRTLYEQRAEVAERHPAGRAINPNNAVRDTGTPFHPGAERYYREAGLWPADAATDEPMDETAGSEEATPEDGASEGGASEEGAS
jgi:TRAP transporter TAXI family solute receptor